MPWKNIYPLKKFRDFDGTIVISSENDNHAQIPVIKPVMSNATSNLQLTPKYQPSAKPTSSDSCNVDPDQNGPYNQNGQFAEADDLTTFFKNMEQTARKFNGLLQVKIKRMVSDIIYDAEEQWLKQL